jgi:hypothetical protein
MWQGAADRVAIFLDVDVKVANMGIVEEMVKVGMILADISGVTEYGSRRIPWQSGRKRKWLAAEACPTHRAAARL